MLILGLNAYHGDVAAALIRDGELVAALEEERFARIKHVAGIPGAAMRACLAMAGAEPRDVDVFAVARARRAHLWPKLRFALTHRPGVKLFGQHQRTTTRTERLPDAVGAALGLSSEHVAERLHHVEHHPAHLASAFYASGFDEATCCAIDAFGDFVSTSVAAGRGSQLHVLDRTFFPHSLGLLYLAVTQFLGFKKYGDEYKVMGLAPYGQPKYVDAVSQLLTLIPGGGFELSLDCFNHWTGNVTMDWAGGEPTIPDAYTARVAELLGPPRRPDDEVTQRHKDLAASLQRVFEASVFHVLNGAHARSPHDRLCLAGGCAMNSVANGKIRQHTPFRELYIQPASGDNGTALGAALHVWHQQHGRSAGLRMEHGYWGTSYSDDQIASAIDTCGGTERFRRTAIADEAARCHRTAAHIADGRVIGWFQGRMEWGARALGNRSILADPRRADMRQIINVKIKFRETFRPFAPSILEEAIDDYFVDAVADPFMIQVYPVREEQRAAIPAVTHVDGSGRLQSVSRRTNPLYWHLIDAFRQRTGVPILLNTSFNENEPIVQQPAEALDCFLRTDMDVLVLGSHVLEKVDVPAPAA
ncbi:MAG TPA: carbamoyltransferase C-terminal domain-containing protein [Vicinamibacterales bacterium]|nr:carbamoyltransferase C-terminal domain-containing protein [Vicinamibacterales bacterium]